MAPVPAIRLDAVGCILEKARDASPRRGGDGRRNHPNGHPYPLTLRHPGCLVRGRRRPGSSGAPSRKVPMIEAVQGAEGQGGELRGGRRDWSPGALPAKPDGVGVHGQRFPGHRWAAPSANPRVRATLLRDVASGLGRRQDQTAAGRWRSRSQAAGWIRIRIAAMASCQPAGLVAARRDRVFPWPRPDGPRASGRSHRRGAARPPATAHAPVPGRGETIGSAGILARRPGGGLPGRTAGVARWRRRQDAPGLSYSER
jgi:hypothetical protein